MSLNSNNQLKFTEGSITEPLTITKAGIEELEFGSKCVIHIKQTIEGYDHFLPSPGLEKKIKEENVDIGDKITIEKVPPSDKYKYGYFTVKVVEKNAQTNKIEMDKYATGEIKPVEPAHKNDTMSIHELTVRVEKLETTISTLWTDYGNRTSDAGHKVGDDKLPF